MSYLLLSFFIFTIFFCLCTYIFYPMILWILGILFPLKIHRKEFIPNVSIIIPVYNEEKNIAKKIENTLALQYPKDRIEILVGSDGSIDNTASIVQKYSEQGVQFIDFKINRGKTAIQNDLVEQSKGEILIFTDAASFLNADALTNITRSFADEGVGCGAGRMCFLNIGYNLNTQSQGIYWRYEFKLRELESRLGSLIGVDGPLYAVRRQCYTPLGENIISDFITPLLVLKQGKKVILESNAIVDEEPTRKSSQEFKTRRRITVRGLTGLFHYRELLNPLQYPFLAFQIIFHKILRWCVGPMVVLNFIACIALSQHRFFKAVLISYVIFSVASALGWVGARFGIKNKVLSVPYYFSLVNIAATVGIIDFVRKKQVVSWKPVRD
jgi:cellulose synthase/poly-beta-1,6-N-acetylglucosamine synthase-like glycosyltransferase